MRLSKSRTNTKSKPSAALSSRGAVGIDIGQDAIRMVQLSGRSLNQIQLEKYAVVKLPKDIVKGGRIQDFDQIVSFLQQAYGQLKTSNRNIVACLPQSFATIETVVYNARESDMDLEDFAELEISQLVSLDEVNYDYRVVGKSSNPPGEKILLVAARTEEVDARVEALESAGLAPAFMDVDIFAQANAFSHWINQNAEELSHEKIAIISISETEMLSLVMQGGQILYKQESALSGTQLSQLIQRTYQVEEADAYMMRVSSGNRPADYQSQVADRFNVQIAQEVQRALQFYYTTLHDEGFNSIKRIFLTGSAAQQAGLPQIVSSQTNLDAELVNPIEYINIANKANTPDFQEAASSLTVALGLALRGM